MSKTLNAADLDDLVNSTLSEGKGIHDMLNTDEHELLQSKNLVDSNTGSTVDFTYIYNKLGEMIDNANDALKMIQAIQPDPSDLSTVSAVTSMMNVIKGCVSEFTKLHAQHIKFENQKKLEEIRYNNKIRLIEEKRKNKLETNEDNNASIQLSSSDIIEFIEWKKQRDQEKIEKNNRI